MSAKQQKHVKKEKVYIYGKHALSEALLNTPQAIRKVFLSPSQKDTHLLELIAKAKIPLAPLKENGESRVGKDAVHQGVIGVLDTTSLLTPFNDFIKTIDTKKSPALVILGEVQDPHNVGAIIRSAAAFGISGILIPEHNQVGITGTVVKTSAGMAFRIPLISIGNVNNAVRTLKDIGFWVYGLEMNGKNPLTEERFSEPSLFIMGNEASGIRKKTLELCDVSLSIKMHPRCESLNVAASAAVVFYAWSTQHVDVL